MFVEVIFGSGDNMSTNLIGSVKLAPLFPLVGDGSARHQPVYVKDLCEVICLVAQEADRESLHRKAFPVTGPEVVTLKQVGSLVSNFYISYHATSVLDGAYHC